MHSATQMNKKRSGSVKIRYKIGLQFLFTILRFETLKKESFQLILVSCMFLFTFSPLSLFVLVSLLSIRSVVKPIQRSGLSDTGIRKETLEKCLF